MSLAHWLWHALHCCNLFLLFRLRRHVEAQYRGRGGGGGYERTIITQRIPKLYLHFALYVLLFYATSLLLGETVPLRTVVQAFFAYSTALGNVCWYIAMILTLYAICGICFMLPFLPSQHAKMGAVWLACLALAVFLTLTRPNRADCFLCFPAGMLFFQWRAHLEAWLAKLRCPLILPALAVMMAGGILSHIVTGYYVTPPSLGDMPHALFLNLLSNLCIILFALGLTLSQGCIQLRSPSRFLQWAGGPAIFTILMFHMLPIKILLHFHFNQWQELFLFACVIITLAGSYFLAPLWGLASKRLSGRE